MASERSRRRIERLLDEADEAVTQLDWKTVSARQSPLQTKDHFFLLFRSGHQSGADRALTPAIAVPYLTFVRRFGGRRGRNPTVPVGLLTHPDKWMGIREISIR